MPFTIKLADLTRILKGKLNLNGDYYTADSMVDVILNIDSRTIKEGETFVCIKGNNTDGYNFAIQSVNSGAIGLITESEINFETKKPFFEIVVQNTELALKEIGKYILNTIKPVQICITGSSGKTTVKELIYSVLSQKLIVSKSFGNLNTPIGIPLSLSKIDKNTKYLVIELSASYPGEMDENLSIVNPDIGIITGIGESHLEFFSNIENVFIEKAKLAKALKKNGVLLANADNYLAKASLNLVENGYSYGISNLANIIAKDIKFLSDYSTFNVSINGNDFYGFKIKAIGEHFILDSLPAIYLALNFGLTVSEVNKGLFSFEPLTGRGRIIKLINDVIVVDDSYNANPYSFEFSINAFKKIQKIRSILVMGDMLELGSSSPELHKKVGEFINYASINIVLYIGEYGKYVKEKLNNNIEFLQFEKIEDIINYLKENISLGDAVLIKGSNGMNLKSVVEELKSC